MDLEKDDLIRIYRVMLQGRICDERITQLALEGRLPAHHPGMGHEGIGVGVGYALRPTDATMPSHRSGNTLGLMRGRITVADTIFAAFGKSAARPSATTTQPAPRFLRPVGSLGAQIPVAVGVAMADKLRGRDSVTICFMGDGGANRGDFHEGVNLAAAHRAPVIFLIENNGFAISLSTREATGIEDFSDRAQGYGMPGMVADGGDVLAVYEIMKAAVERARQGQGPSLIECKVLRWTGHATTDSDSYRSEELRLEARRHCPIERLGGELVGRGIATDAEVQAVRDEVAQEVEDAIRAAEAAPISQSAAITPEYVRSLVYAD